MRLMLDSLWRALAYGFRPGVILRAAWPLVVGVALITLLGYAFWDVAVDQLRLQLDAFPYTPNLLHWLSSNGAEAQKAVLPPLLVAIAMTPVMLLLALLSVIFLLTPALAQLVAGRRFSVLQALPARAFAMTLLWSTGSCVLALLALVMSIPLWVIPPLWLVLPPLILGWLNQRLLVFAALVRHANREERILVAAQHRVRLLIMGIVCAYLVMAPCVVWVWLGGPRFASLFIVLAPLAMGLYVVLFAFSSLWFTHYCLAALRHIRTTVTGVAPAKEMA